MTADPLDTLQLSDPSLEADGLRWATVFSPALGHRADCTLWAPAGRRTASLRLVVLLHGVYGSHWAWTSLGGAHLVAAEVARQEGAGSFALAMPSDGLFGHGSGYVATQGGDVERWITEEVPTVAQVAIDGVDADAPIAIAGLSMGGFGALSIGARHPGRVVAAAGMSSITDFDQMASFVGSLEGYEIDPGARSVLGSLVHHREQLPAVRFDCGRDDPLIEANRSLHIALQAEGIPHGWEEHAGGHDWTYWRAHLAESLRFCAR